MHVVTAADDWWLLRNDSKRKWHVLQFSYIYILCTIKCFHRYACIKHNNQPSLPFKIVDMTAKNVGKLYKLVYILYIIIMLGGEVCKFTDDQSCRTTKYVVNIILLRMRVGIWQYI